MMPKTRVPAKISPKDPTFLQHGLVLFLVSFGVCVPSLLAGIYDTAVRWRISSSLSMTYGTFMLLAQRYITLQRFSALRLVISEPQFSDLTYNRVILSVDQVRSIYYLQLASVAFSNLPLLLSKFSEGDIGQLAARVEGPMGWFFGAINIGTYIVCCVILLLPKLFQVQFTKTTVKGVDMPLSSITIDDKTKDWQKVASTSRRHDVYIRRTNNSKFEGRLVLLLFTDATS